MQHKVEAFFMNLFCMKGSWKWAKKQMLAGYMIRSTEWVGDLKFRANPQSSVFEINVSKEESAKWMVAATNFKHNVYAEITTYEIFMWEQEN